MLCCFTSAYGEERVEPRYNLYLSVPNQEPGIFTIECPTFNFFYYFFLCLYVWGLEYFDLISYLVILFYIYNKRHVVSAKRKRNTTGWNTKYMKQERIQKKLDHIEFKTINKSLTLISWPRTRTVMNRLKCLTDIMPACNFMFRYQ